MSKTIKLMGREFIMSKVSSLDGRTKVYFSEVAPLDTPSSQLFSLVASPSGLGIEGKLAKEIESMDDLQDFAKLVTDAWSEHKKLAPKIARPDDGGVLN